MKKKLGRFITVMVAVTMFMGMSMTAFAKGDIPTPYGTLKDDRCEGPDHFVFIGDNRILAFETEDLTWKLFNYSGSTVEMNGHTFRISGEEELYKVYREQYHYDWGGEYSFIPALMADEVFILPPEHSHSFTWKIVFDATTTSDGLEAEVCSCGEMRNPQPISSFAYTLYRYALPLIEEAEPGQTVTLEFGEWNSFPKAFMEKVAVKSNEGVNFVFHYKWNKEEKEICIPAGTPVDLEFEWYGPAKMAELYGAYSNILDVAI